MHRRKFSIFMAIVLAAAFLCWGADKGNAQSSFGSIDQQSLQSGVNTDYERHRNDLLRLNEALKARGYKDSMGEMPTGPTKPPYAPGIIAPAVAINPLYPPGIGFNPAVDYTLPNFAYSPNIRKFVDGLPGLGLPACTPGTGMIPNITGGTCNQNNLGQYIPIANPDLVSFAGSDYYALGLAQYSRQLHSDLPPTMLRGYYQLGDARN